MAELRPESIIVSAGRPEGPGAPLSQPPVLTSTYRHDDGANRYLRNEGSDSVGALEAALGALDGGTATVYASGLGAVAAVIGTLPVGSVVVAPEAAYAGTVALCLNAQKLGRLTLRQVDITDTDAVIAELDGAALLWLETTTNPLLGIPDLPVLIEAAHAAGVRVAVDATFTTALNVRPLDLGADVVMHSATKYVAGHSDLVQGVLITRDAELHEAFVTARRLGGAFPGAMDCFLALRGLRTLAVRFERAQANAAELARRLAAHPAVSRVRYSGLPDDPFHERATRLLAGYGAMISFEVAGTAADAERVCSSLCLITHATSLGGVESLIERRAMHEGDRSLGVPETLLRFSVGIEHVDDLWGDLQQALGN